MRNLDPFPDVQLREVLNIWDNAVSVSGLSEVRLAGVYSFGKGLFSRGSFFPSKTSYKYYNRLVTDDFVISQPKAWEGALARVTRDFDGWFLSPVFPTFRANRERLEPSYLEWFCRQARIWEILQRKSRGLGARRESVSPEQFLSLEIPLPPLDEQRRIVARIEELSSRTEEVRILQHHIEADAKRMLLSLFQRVIANVDFLPMAVVAPVVRRQVEIETEGNYPEVGIRSFGKGTFHKPILRGVEVGTKKLYSIEAGDLIFNNVFAWEGAVAVTKLNDAGRFGSHRFISCVPKKGVVTSNFLCFYFLTTEGLEKLGEASPGGAGRNRTLGLEALKKIKVPIPSYEKQLWFDRLQAEVDAVKRLQDETAEELNALMPSILSRAFSGGQ